MKTSHTLRLHHGSYWAWKHKPEEYWVNLQTKDPDLARKKASILFDVPEDKITIPLKQQEHLGVVRLSKQEMFILLGQIAKLDYRIDELRQAKQDLAWQLAGQNLGPDTIWCAACGFNLVVLPARVCQRCSPNRGSKYSQELSLGLSQVGRYPEKEPGL